jgi:hypothetical protein
VVNREKLEVLLDQSRAVKEGERDEVDETLVEYFNSLWTYEALQDRRVDLLEDTFEIVGFEQLDEEFELSSDRGGGSETNSQSDRTQGTANGKLKQA